MKHKAKQLKKTSSLPKVPLLIVALVFAGIGSYFLFFSHATGPNVWVSTTGNDSSCVRLDSSKPCLSFQKACTIAQPGDIVQVNNGTYGAQTVICAQSSPGITFEAQTLHGVLVSGSNDNGGLEIGSRSANSSWLTFDGIDAYEAGVIGPCQTACSSTGGDYPIGDSHRTNHITISNMKVTAQGDTGADAPFYVDQTDYFTWQHSEVGPICCNADGADIYPTVSHITVNDVYIHDVGETCADIPPSRWSNCSSTSTPFASNHVDCLQFVGGDTITISNSRLVNCAAGTLMNGVNRQKYNNYTLSNNFFQGHVLDMSGGGGAGGSFGYAYTGFVHLYFNDVPDGTNFQDWQPGGDYQLVGNIFGDIPSNHGACTVGGTGGDADASFTVVKYNIFDGGQPGSAAACGDPTNINANASYVNASNRAAGIDLHLNTGSPGINAIPTSFCTSNPSYCPTTDIDGQSRPQGSAYDMGADEFIPAANVWISTAGSDTTCVRGDPSKPCASLAKALSLAQAGDIIQMAGGTYGSAFGCSTDPVRHQFTVTQGFASNVTITVAAGATAIVPCQVELNGNYVGFDATGGTIRIDGFYAGADHQFLKNIDIYCEDQAPYPVYTITNPDPSSPHPPAGGSHNYCTAPLRGSGNYFTMTGGSVGPTTADESVTGLDDSSIGYSGTPSFWTLNGVYFHDARWGDDCNGTQSCHTENLYLTGVHDFTIQNSHFDYCGNSTCIFMTKQSGQASAYNLNIVGNVFTNASQPGIDAAGDLDPTAQVLVDYNDFIDTSMLVSGGNVTMTGNISYNNPCPGFSTTGSKSFDHNLWIYDTSTGGSADQCGATDHLYNVGHNPDTDIWVNSAGGDYHLKTGSPALDIGNISNYSLASPDYYGQARYAGTAPDAGAAEYNTGGTGTPAPTVTISANPTNITSGGSSTLTWSSTNATACTASGAWSGSKATSGTQSVSPITTSTYTLTCSGAGGSSSPASATVNLPVVGDFTIGEATILSQGDNGNANLLLAQSTSLQQAATIKSLSFYVTNAAGKLRLGIYDASGPNGGPGSLKASTAELTPTTGWNTATVTSQVQLPVGTYWLAYLPSDNNLAFEKGQDATSSGVLYNYTYAALPATFSTSPSTTTSHWSFYATLNSGSSGSVAGDINGDSHVNSGDLTLLLANYGTGYPAADFNNNGTVDAGDFSVVLSNFGK